MGMMQDAGQAVPQGQANATQTRQREAGQAQAAGRLTNLLGAGLSLALLVGVGVWGFKLMVRDVSGVPVVRAAEGPMRVQPEEPGGQLAVNQGLSVNYVAAGGTAAAPADRLILAPEPLNLTIEDEPPAARDETPAVAPTAGTGEGLSGEEALQLAAVEALAEQIAATATPLETLQPAPETTVVTGGIGRSLRPVARPVPLTVTTAAPAPAPARTDTAAAGALDVDPLSIPVGTRLAQLGAYESAEVARKEWDRLSGKFAEYLVGKNRVIQKAQSGGRTFYRLRAMGFADLNDARRFCSALVAERAECIPVVTR